MTRRRWLLACAACVVVGVAIGYGLRPEPDVRVEERVVEAFASRENWVMRREAETVSQVRREEQRGPVTTTWHPDGRVERHEEPVAITETTDTREREVERVEVERVVEVEVETVREVQVETPLPDWRAGALVGLSLDGPVYGAQVERRILGPLALGAWGLTSGAAGVSLSTAF